MVSGSENRDEHVMESIPSFALHLLSAYSVLGASLVAQTVKKKKNCLMQETWVQSLLGQSPGGGHGNPLRYSCLENPHGQRSLAGYNLWGRRVGHS